MKILVVQIGRYGDMILTTPLFVALKQNFPMCELHVLASAQNHDILQGQTIVDMVHVYRKSVYDVFQVLTALRSENLDLLIDPKDHFSNQSFFIARVLQAKESIGYNGLKRPVFTHAIPDAASNDKHDPPLHCVERVVNVLHTIGLGATNFRPQLEIVHESMQFSLQYISKPKGSERLIVLNISAGQVSREWPANKWTELCSKISGSGRKLVILSAPRDHQRAQKIALSIKEAVTCFYSRTIHDAVALISRAHVLITPDSAPVHIASAFDTPCLALFNSVNWNLEKFRPLSSLNTVVQPDIGSGEVSDIAVQPVADALESLLACLVDKGMH